MIISAWFFDFPFVLVWRKTMEMWRRCALRGQSGHGQGGGEGGKSFRPGGGLLSSLTPKGKTAERPGFQKLAESQSTGLHWWGLYHPWGRCPCRNGAFPPVLMSIQCTRTQGGALSLPLTAFHQRAAQPPLKCSTCCGWAWLGWSQPCKMDLHRTH